MQAERIRERAAVVEGGAVVCVSRDGDGDSRKIFVPLEGLREFHMASKTGGRNVCLPEPAVAAWMSCDLIPEGVPFGHGHVHCVRRGRPSSIRVLVAKAETDGTLYYRLREAAEECTARWQAKACS